jgi:hypothetical protein
VGDIFVLDGELLEVKREDGDIYIVKYGEYGEDGGGGLGGGRDGRY